MATTSKTGTHANLTIGLKRAYEAAEAHDGLRILVERLWPRGVSKLAARIDHWVKDVAPTAALRQWYGHEPARWPEFQQRYRAQLDGNPDAVAALRRLLEQGPVTFVFAASDVERNSAVLLREYLLER